MNADLIRDEGHANAMTLAQLEERMRGWLSAEYTAIVFERRAQPVAYALFRDDEGRGVLLRHFFVCAECRRQGLGRRAFALLVEEVLAPGTRVAVEVLARNERALAFWRAVGFTEYAVTLERR
jgi:GNAT superfamily N-acetyltransferase